MFSTKTLRRFFEPGSTGPSAPGSAPLHALLGAGRVGILSAACCDAMSRPKDEQLARHLAEAMQHTGSQRPVVQATLTATRQQLRELGSAADTATAAFQDELSSVFQTHGLAAFPLLIVDGQIAFYGGVPSPDAIASSLARR